MSVQSSRNNIARVDTEIARIEKSLSGELKKEAEISKKQGQIERSINKNTSVSSLKTKQSQLAKLQSDLAKVGQKKADLTKKIADKKKQKAQYEQQLERETKSERNKLEQLEKRRRIDELNHQRQITAELQRQKELIVEMPTQESLTTNTNKEYDIFISHASEDKEDFVRPLAEKLESLGIKTWYDEFKLKIGDSLRQKIDEGLINSRYALVVLSDSFLKKKSWTEYELNGLTSKEMNGQKVILPIWHKVSKDQVLSYSPTIADKLALNTAIMSIDEIANEIHELLK